MYIKLRAARERGCSFSRGMESLGVQGPQVGSVDHHHVEESMFATCRLIVLGLLVSMIVGCYAGAQKIAKFRQLQAQAQVAAGECGSCTAGAVSTCGRGAAARRVLIGARTSGWNAARV